MNNEITIIPNLPTDGIYLTQPMPTGKDPVLAYLNGNMKSATGRYTQGRVILTIASWLNSDPALINWPALEYAHISALCNHAESLFAPATARKYRSALMGITRASFALGLITGDQYMRSWEVPPITGESLPAGRNLTQGEINALVNSCTKDPTAAGVRDAAIICLMYVCLVRRSSLVALEYSKYDPQTGRIVWHGKRNKEYATYATGGAKAALDDWLVLRGSDPGPIFHPITQTGKIMRSLKPLSAHDVYKICQKRGEQAGVAHFSPHDFRRTAAGELMERGVDINTVSKIMAHDDVKTTGKYDRRPDEVKRTAAEKLHVPYVSRTA